MYISKIELENIRCFDKLTIDFKKGEEIVLWTTLLGDNSTGKTTLLKCIAIGLCDESSAAGLLKESEEGYIRHDSKKPGLIQITLSDKDGKVMGKIRTKITQIEKEGSKRFLYENLSQKTIPKNFKPWGNIFICAYGIGRGVSGTGDITGYTPISAVYNLFNYPEGLQNPELVIRRFEDVANKSEVNRILRTVLNIPKNSEITVKTDGIKIKGGPFKKSTALRDISDGYKSTFQWVTDFFGWAISYQEKNNKSEEIEGIVLVDSIEEHLHPKWQRIIVNTLHKELFSKVQFIVATHSPLVASSTVDYTDAELIELELDENFAVIKKIINKEDLQGLRADEVLRHEAFGLLATASPGSISDIERYGILASKGKLTKEEKLEKVRLKKLLSKDYSFGDNKFEIEVENAVKKTLYNMIDNPTDTHMIEIKKQLREIFTKEI